MVDVKIVEHRSKRVPGRPLRVECRWVDRRL